MGSVDFNKVKEHAFAESKEYTDAIRIKGYDFSKPFDFNKFLEAYTSTGLQASHLGTAIEIVKKAHTNQSNFIIDLSENSKGIYFIRVFSKEIEVVSKKIVIQ